MRIKKYVLDANIWLSYFMTQREQYLAGIIIENELTLFYSDELLQEIKRVVGYKHLEKYKLDGYKISRFIQIVAVHFELIYPIKNYIPEDQDDNYIVALALQTNSGFITSGDSHILSQKEVLEKKYTKLIIITKAEFEKKFS
ncbi:MAG: putative toxin-antitoxin system toxin component, PIN family [Bacteroidota bacterium]|nr:putative toxin-antitoxin system toxin component, PIN family [Bacteroidota bacterium]